MVTFELEKILIRPLAHHSCLCCVDRLKNNTFQDGYWKKHMTQHV